MTARERVTTDEAKKVGERIGIDWASARRGRTMSEAAHLRVYRFDPGAVFEAVCSARSSACSSDMAERCSMPSSCDATP